MISLLKENVMATLCIRHVPEQLYEDIKRFAESNRRSISAEALAIMTEGIEQRRLQQQRQEALAALDEIQRLIGPTPGDSLELLREDRER